MTSVSSADERPHIHPALPVEAELAVTVPDDSGRSHRYRTPGELMAAAAQLEEQGYAGIVTKETHVDPLLAITAAAAATSRVELGTAVTIALARSPMTVAATAHQLQAHTGGRFVLGLGSQVKAHITRRFGMPWDKPVGRMEAHIRAVKDIWRCWRTDEELDHRSAYFSITLMPPSFRPPDHGKADPPILVGAVGPAMTAMATRVADGLITHPFTTPDYLRSVTLPAIDRGLAAAGRGRDGFRIHGSVLTASGETEAERRHAVEELRRRLSFYGSTPAYRQVLEHHGWGDLADRLHALSRSSDPQRWTRMALLVPDEMVRTFGVVGGAGEIRDETQRRFGGVLDRVRGTHLRPS